MGQPSKESKKRWLDANKEKRPIICRNWKLKAIAVSESLLRREAVENAVADLRLEGLAPTADARLIFEQFVGGYLIEEELLNAVQLRWKNVTQEQLDSYRESGKKAAAVRWESRG